MGIKPNAIKRLRNELAAVGKEIDKRIVKLDKLSVEIKQGYEDFAAALADKQVLAEADFRKSLMSSGDEVWQFAWDNVWDAITKFKHKATTETKFNYKELEASLRARQSSLKTQLKISEMWGEQVWTEVWNAVWRVMEGVNDKYRLAITAEIAQVEEELQTLLDKQLALQTELEERLKSGGGLYSVLKKMTNSADNSTDNK